MRNMSRLLAYWLSRLNRYLRQDLEAEELLRASDETLETYEFELR